MSSSDEGRLKHLRDLKRDLQASDPKKRPVFAAGDSDTDIEFLRDATYRLVVDRNKTEIMCNAFNNTDGHWRVNPMFIQPKAKKTP